jgi:hypothetical protein
MRTLCQVLGLAFVLLLAPLAKADTLDFTLIGAGSTYTFSIDSSPTPDSFVNNEYFQLNNVLVNINGIFGQSSEVRFFNSADDGGLIFLDIPTSAPQATSSIPAPKPHPPSAPERSIS